MKPIADMTSLEIAAYVCDQLKQHGVVTTLSGGACTEIYSHGDYTSMDIDLINQYNEEHKKIISIMLDLGFKQDGRHFYYEGSPYGIEFPSGPPAIGEEFIKDVAEIETEAGVLRILTPTDAIKDRLAAYYHWDSDRTLEQALWIAQKNDFSMDNIEAWSVKEGMLDKFATFKTSYMKSVQESIASKAPKGSTLKDALKSLEDEEPTSSLKV